MYIGQVVRMKNEEYDSLYSSMIMLKLQMEFIENQKNDDNTSGLFDACKDAWSALSDYLDIYKMQFKEYFD